MLEEPYGSAVSAQRVIDALKAEPNTRGVFVQASESSTGAAHDVKAMGEAIKKTDAFSSSTPSPASAPCLSISMAGVSTL